MTVLLRMHVGLLLHFYSELALGSDPSLSPETLKKTFRASITHTWHSSLYWKQTFILQKLGCPTHLLLFDLIKTLSQPFITAQRRHYNRRVLTGSYDLFHSFHLASYSAAGFLKSLLTRMPHTPKLPGQSICVSIVLFPPQPSPE